VTANRGSRALMAMLSALFCRSIAAWPRLLRPRRAVVLLVSQLMQCRSGCDIALFKSPIAAPAA